MGLNQQRREGFAVIYRNKPQFKGLDTYLRLAPQATSKRVNIGEATVFASESEAQRYAKDFAKAPRPESGRRGGGPDRGGGGAASRRPAAGRDDHPDDGRSA